MEFLIEVVRHSITLESKQIPRAIYFHWGLSYQDIGHETEISGNTEAELAKLGTWDAKFGNQMPNLPFRGRKGLRAQHANERSVT